MKVELVNFLDVPLELQLETRNWRNSSGVVPYFRIKHIDEETHGRWLDSLTKESPTNIAFLIKVDDDYVGVSYFHSIDYSKQSGDWGIYIYRPDFQGLGVGEIVLKNCIDYARTILKLNDIFLDVLESNQRAIALYEKMGFRFMSKDDSFCRYRYHLE